MAVNKVEYGDTTLIDLTDDTVTPGTLAEGITAHSADGELIEGEFPINSVYRTDDTSSTILDDTDYIPISDYSGVKKKSLLSTLQEKFWTYVANKLATVATTGKYNDLLGKYTTKDNQDVVWVSSDCKVSYYNNVTKITQIPFSETITVECKNKSEYQIKKIELATKYSGSGNIYKVEEFFVLTDSNDKFPNIVTIQYDYTDNTSRYINIEFNTTQDVVIYFGKNKSEITQNIEDNINYAHLLNIPDAFIPGNSSSVIWDKIYLNYVYYRNSAVKVVLKPGESFVVYTPGVSTGYDSVHGVADDGSIVPDMAFVNNAYDVGQYLGDTYENNSTSTNITYTISITTKEIFDCYVFFNYSRSEVLTCLLADQNREGKYQYAHVNSGGLGLSSVAFSGSYNDLTGTKPPTDAQKNVQSDWNATSGDALILNKPLIINKKLSSRVWIFPASCEGTSADGWFEITFPTNKGQWMMKQLEITVKNHYGSAGTMEKFLLQHYSDDRDSAKSLNTLNGVVLGEAANYTIYGLYNKLYIPSKSYSTLIIDKILTADSASSNDYSGTTITYTTTNPSTLSGIVTGSLVIYGRITEIKMNGSSKGTKGVVDLGTVLTSHQDISGKLNRSGGSLTGSVSLAETKNILLRPNHSSYTSGIGYDTSGNECIALWAKNSVTRLRWYAGKDMSSLSSGSMMGITPDFEISKADGSAKGYIGGSRIFTENNSRVVTIWSGTSYNGNITPTANIPRSGCTIWLKFMCPSMNETGWTSFFYDSGVTNNNIIMWDWRSSKVVNVWCQFGYFKKGTETTFSFEGMSSTICLVGVYAVL